MQTFRLVHKIFLAALLSLTICLAHSQESPQVFSNEALRIGLITSLTGGVATWGNSVKTAIEIANAEAKHPAELFFQDEETCIPTKALSAFNYLVSERKVDILITSCLEGAQAIAPLARRSRIPFFISGRSSQEFQASNPNALSWISLLDFEGRAIGQLIQERRLARGSALVWSGYFGVQFAKGIERAIADLKLTFDYNVTEIDQGAIPVAAEVQRLLRNDPDVVFLMMSEPAAAFVVKQLKTYRYKGLIVLQSSMLQTYDPKARAIFDGALQLKFPANSAEFSRLQSIIQAKQGENIADDFVFSYDGFKVLLAEATICKREQPEALETCINSRIRDDSWRQGASGSFRYMKDGSTDRPMVFKTITERGFR